MSESIQRDDLIDHIFAALGANEELPLFDDDALSELRLRLADDLQGAQALQTVEAVQRAVAVLQLEGFTHAAVQLVVIAQHAAHDAGIRPEPTEAPGGEAPVLRAPQVDGERPEGSVPLSELLSAGQELHQGPRSTPPSTAARAARPPKPSAPRPQTRRAFTLR